MKFSQVPAGPYQVPKIFLKKTCCIATTNYIFVFHSGRNSKPFNIFQIWYETMEYKQRWKDNWDDSIW